MADSSPPPDALTEFRDLISRFIRLIDQASSNWQNLYHLDELDRVEKCHEYRAMADDVRQQIVSTSKAIVSTIVPPPGQTAVQFVAAIRDDVEEAYNLFRYTDHCDPNLPQVDSWFEQTRTAMHHRWPKLHDNLWIVWRHLNHTLELNEAINAGHRGEEPKTILEEGDRPIPRAKTKSGSVLLFDRPDKPIVNGVEKPILTMPQYDVVLALLQAGEKGLTKDTLDFTSKHTDARKILKRLSNNDPDWQAVIFFPVTTGKGYRIT